MRIKLALLPIALLASAPVAAQDKPEKEVWTPIGDATSGDAFSLDYSREETVTNEFGTPVIRIWLKIDLVASTTGDVKRLTHYEMNCADNSARVLDGAAYDAAGNVINRYKPPVPNPLKPIRAGSMATRIFRIVCKTT